MKAEAVILILEIISLAVMCRMWCGKGRWIGKLIWSVVLLVPVLGLVLYLFLTNDPDRHGEDLNEHWD